MDYRLENLSNTEFESLINSICQDILGTGVVIFSTGKDGGRDGRYTGTAKNYPSTTDPWKGKFIIQAKHTENPIASCSDREFEEIINKEIVKIKKLKTTNEVDNYLIFTNRKYSANKGEKLRNKIISETQIINCNIIGKETINNLYINPNKEIQKQFRLNSFLSFDFSDEDIKEIIIEFSKELKSNTNNIKDEVEKLKRDFSIIEKHKKNKKNILSKEYFDNFIVGESLMHFKAIEDFLNNPINVDLKEVYYDTAYELNQLIFLKREEFSLFEEIFVFIYKKVIDGATVLKGNKRHVMTFLHYMYYECLLGIK